MLNHVANTAGSSAVITVPQALNQPLIYAFHLLNGHFENSSSGVAGVLLVVVVCCAVC